MSFFWIQHQIGLLIFLLVILLITLSNIRILRKLGNYPMPDHFPRVSVLVPARNEENNIGHCVRSLLNQDYPDFEVLSYGGIGSSASGSGAPLPIDKSAGEFKPVEQT